MRPAEPAPLVQFQRLIMQCRPPQRADRTACGTIPSRAARYCDALTSASAYGYYLFAPMDLSLLWDGADIYWSYPALDRWLLLDVVQYPGFSASFDAAAPAALQGCSPPFLTVLPEPGHVQVWTGLFARTAADWSLLLRPVANLPGAGGYVAYEGIVETDRWFGPLFTNLRLTRTHTPVKLSSQFPLVQAQPLPRHIYTDATLNRMRVGDGLETLTAADWDAYRDTVVTPNQSPDRPFGGYATEARKRRRCPVSP